ncbi:alpha-L-rhamnosidase C-terminal domain-containing protein [Streptomyces sp. NPDC050759]|uniref:alpha-L-rhamnosidase C-terminal domain-containing protein n=1 Tax=Streptomyces sp. NPDC050759 TaxID=3365635 RepID=UPI0037BA6F80
MGIEAWWLGEVNRLKARGNVVVASAVLHSGPYIPAVAFNSRLPVDTSDLDLAPAPLDRVSASIKTVHGEVSSQWHRRAADGRIELAVTVPYNTDAEIWARPGRRAGSYRFNA